MNTVSSPTDLANWALELLSEAEIQSLDQNNTPARAAKRQWPKTRTVVLSSCIWKCAKETKDLSNSATAPDLPGYSYQSALPGDWLHTVDVWDGDPDSVSTEPIPTKDWDEEQGYLLHNLEYPAIEYVKDLETVSSYSPLLAQAMAYHMAGAIGKKVTGSDQLAAQLREEYLKDKLPDAQMQEGIQKWAKRLSLKRRLKQSPLLQARMTASPWSGRNYGG